MVTKKKYDPAFFDAEEQDTIEALRAGEFRSAKNLPARKAVFKRAAANTQRRKPVTMRLLEDDIAALKVKAIEDGLPYQTLLASLVHKYVTGRLVERD